MNTNRTQSVLLPSILLTLACGACTGTPQWAGSVVQRDGIEMISNPGVPIMAESQPTDTDLWSYQGAEWMDPSRVHAQGGVVTVVDPPANQVHVLSTSGEVSASLGRPGGGPGEFLRLLDALPEGDRLAVLDAGTSSIEYVDRDGRYLSSVHLHGQPWGGFFLGTGELLVKGEFLSDPTEESFGDWVTVTEGRDPRGFTTLPLDPLPEEEGVRCSDLSAWADGAARMRFTTPQIEIFDPTGSLKGEIHIDLPVEPVSEAERTEALSALEASLTGRGLPPPFIQQNLMVMGDRWRVKCRFGPLRFDPVTGSAAFLEQNPDQFGGGNATLHILSGDGVYLAKADFPEPWRDFDMDDGVIYSLTRDAVTDIVTLRAYRLHIPEAVLLQASRVLEEARHHGEALHD